MHLEAEGRRDALAAVMAAAPGPVPVATPGRPDWMADAACREHPEVDFFPTPGKPLAPARRVCAGCLVRDECLAYALGTDVDGVWGGTSRMQRLILQGKGRKAWRKSS